MNISWMPNVLKKRLAGKGAGDIVKESIDTVSGGQIKQCGGCQKRQQLLNDLLSFEDKKTLERAAQIQAEANKKIAEQNPESSKTEAKPKIPAMPWNNEHQIKFDRRKTKKMYHGQIHSIDNMLFRLQSIDNHMADISGYLKTLVEKQNDSSGD